MDAFVSVWTKEVAVRVERLTNPLKSSRLKNRRTKPWVRTSHWDILLHQILPIMPLRMSNKIQIRLVDLEPRQGKLKDSLEVVCSILMNQDRIVPWIIHRAELGQAQTILAQILAKNVQEPQIPIITIIRPTRSQGRDHRKRVVYNSSLAKLLARLRKEFGKRILWSNFWTQTWKKEILRQIRLKLRAIQIKITRQKSITCTTLPWTFWPTLCESKEKRVQITIIMAWHPIESNIRNQG